MEIHFDGKSIIMDDYKSLNSYGFNIRKISSETPDKGHKEELEELYKGIKTNHPVINFETMVNTTYLSLLASEN
jgi:hypothetical protein